MKKTKTKVNFKDHRGEIRDILSHAAVDAVTIITCTPGAIRGNHFHKKTDQYDYILSGKFSCATKNMKAKNGKMNAKIKRTTLKAGDVAFHPAWEAHAFKAEGNAVFISLTKGPRNGKDYEKDVYRLEKPLIK
jgi:dTDP-4-dehydrorhamnose 3,5-epimerase